jgi:hypothetical protein
MASEIVGGVLSDFSAGVDGEVVEVSPVESVFVASKMDMDEEIVEEPSQVEIVG